MSSLKALSGFKLELDPVQKILKDYSTVTNSGISIVLCWIRSHVNIPCNEKADTAAKSALSVLKCFQFVLKNGNGTHCSLRVLLVVYLPQV